MIDILLVNPRTSPNIENNEPLNLLSLARKFLVNPRSMVHKVIEYF
jgi:hypothetical protein